MPFVKLRIPLNLAGPTSGAIGVTGFDELRHRPKYTVTSCCQWPSILRHSHRGE